MANIPARNRKVCARCREPEFIRKKHIHGARKLRLIIFCVALNVSVHVLCAEGQIYAGAMVGISTISGDSRSVINPGSTAFSSYSPENGLALNVLAGKHLTDYFTLQADYVFNRNALTLSAAAVNTGSVAEYEETRQSSQQSVMGSVLVYFRKRESRIRPYLSVGTGFVHLSSAEESVRTQEQFPLPPRKFSSNMIALRVPVGIDVKVHAGWLFRYSFSETLSSNPISDQLSPRGTHSLKNFQNLFGMVREF